VGARETRLWRISFSSVLRTERGRVTSNWLLMLRGKQANRQSRARWRAWRRSDLIDKNYLRGSPRSRQIVKDAKGILIPPLTIKTGNTTSDGREEHLTEYFCDHPGCPNIATQVVGRVIEIGVVAAVCEEHAPKLPQKNK
jgi:hypothetical protein